MGLTWPVKEYVQMKQMLHFQIFLFCLFQIGFTDLLINHIRADLLQ